MSLFLDLIITGKMLLLQNLENHSKILHFYTCHSSHKRSLFWCHKQMGWGLLKIRLLEKKIFHHEFAIQQLKYHAARQGHKLWLRSRYQWQTPTLIAERNILLTSNFKNIFPLISSINVIPFFREPTKWASGAVAREGVSLPYNKLKIISNRDSGIGSSLMN